MVNESKETPFWVFGGRAEAGRRANEDTVPCHHKSVAVAGASAGLGEENQ